MDKKLPQKKVKVVVRVRPPLSANAKICTKAINNSVQILNHRNKDENLQYEFSSVFDGTASQHRIFSECVEPLLGNALDGQNVSIFAYGPTGAGKTHTMLGVLSDPGVIPRVIRSLFKKISHEEAEAQVSFSFLEIYNEKVRDLLASNSSDLPIREDANHNIFVAGLSEKVIKDFDTFKDYFGPATSTRTVAATKLNEYSSRSHSILLLKIRRKIKDKEFIGKVYLIDLAGSEDNRRTGNQGIRLKESGAINKSLFVLGEVVNAINTNSARVPYRNSKLTRILQDSIGGSCHSLMITNVAPEEHYYYDTYCTLNFATKSKKIVNVITTCVEDSPPPPEKPVVTLRPKRRSSMSTEAKVKRPRNSLTVTAGMSEVPAVSSTLIQSRAEVDKEIFDKLEAIVSELNRLKSNNAGSNNKENTECPQSSVQPSPAVSTQSTTPSLMTRSRRSVPSVNYLESPDVIYATPESHPAPPKLVDATNLLVQRHLEGKGRRRASSKLRTKKKKMSEPSCSPLFPDIPRGQSKDKENQRKPSQGSDSDAEFLAMLNTASVKELQQLQTVGKKRAQLIYDWRTLHGKFDFVGALKEVPGFTDKYVSNLLRKNLVLC